MPLVLIPTAFEAGLLFGADLRARLQLDTTVDTALAGVPVTLALCGFGLAAAGAGAAWALSQVQRSTFNVQGTYLVGIAGTYRPRQLPVGAAMVATFARCSGIGAGSGRRHLSAEQLGWSVDDTVSLRTPNSSGIPHSSSLVTGGLLSVTAASGSRYEARQRARAHPDVLAEEMEAYAVALAARLARIPLTVIRGISNVAGDRDTAHWRAADACRAARGVLEQLLTQSSAVSP